MNGQYLCEIISDYFFLVSPGSVIMSADKAAAEAQSFEKKVP
jgi:hypothetical protein